MPLRYIFLFAAGYMAAYNINIFNMGEINMKKVFISILCLLLVGCFQTYNPGRTDLAGLKKNDAFMRATRQNYIPNDKTIALIGGVSNSLVMAPFYKFENYENSVNGLGYSKHYEYGDNFMATVFAYHMRIKPTDMPTDVHSNAFASIYNTETNTLKSAEGKQYKNIRVMSDGFTNITGIDKSIEFKRFEYRAYDMRTNNLDVISVMYLTVYNGALLKVRINYPAANKEIGTKFEKLFIQELVANLADFDGDVAAFEAAREKAISNDLG